MASGRSRYSFDNRMRVLSPPIDEWTMRRTVWSNSVGVRSTESRGGRGTSYGLAVHVANQPGEAGAGAIDWLDGRAQAPQMTTKTRPRRLGRIGKVFARTATCSESDETRRPAPLLLPSHQRSVGDAGYAAAR